MRVALLIVGILGVLFIVFQIYTSMATGKSEQQPYKVIRIENDFEIRYYPAAAMATITSTAKTYRDLGSSGFKKLANYIFGGNQEKQQIAMTSPVHMDINDSASTMSFVMPSEFNDQNLPKPSDSSVQIKMVPATYVAAIQFDGFASDEKIAFYKEKLAASLKAHGIANHGNFRFLGYNPPFQLINRRNEIIVDVDKM